MNEARLVMSSMEFRAGEYPGPDERPPVYDGRWGQYVLDTCGSVGKVIKTDALVRVQDQSAPSHYLVADAEGNCVASRDSCAVSYAFGTLVHVVAAPQTRWNIVHDIADREIWFRSAQSPTFKHISLDAFDFSCDAPKLMLDVNAALDGDVEGHFTPYDHDVNLNVFRTFCDRYGIKVSAEDAASLIRFFEGFECTR